MRLAGKITDQKHAEILHNYLFVNGVEHDLEQVAGDSGQLVWEIWVHADEKLEQAKRTINEFLINPEGEVYTETAKKASIKSRQEEAEIREYQKKMFDKRRTFSPFRIGILTGFLIALSIVVTLSIDFGKNLDAMNIFSFSKIYTVEENEWYRTDIPEIRKGEIWRLITPIFMHFSFMGIPFLHILFNMMWLYDLGRALERRHGSIFFGLLVVLIAILSNYGQYVMSGPSFGGMSGVVYGLFGYVWIRGKTDPFYELHLHPTTVTMMIVWFFLCLFGFLGSIGNTAHGVGLLTGMLVGFIMGRIAKKKRFN